MLAEIIIENMSRARTGIHIHVEKPPKAADPPCVL
jgi:hypothetical protein